MSAGSRLGLFEGYGVELEYMVVDAQKLTVLPITDQVLMSIAGNYDCELEMGELSWSNELVLHVIELKTTEPAKSLEKLPRLFQNDIRRINDLLRPLDGRLMPTAMHPWMDPSREMRLWPHDYSPVYHTFDRIFDCRGHGWANLQSIHLNLPFADDEQFGRLHAAIRLVLPLLPALAASSPIAEGRVTGQLDTRMDYYRNNARRIPSVTGQVIPEPVYSRADYQRLILQRMYADIAPHDPDKTLQHEWLNARGAIARFDRHAIEIRVLDVQECPTADLAICAAITAVLQALVAERWTPLASQQACPTDLLATTLSGTVRDGERSVLFEGGYLRHFGIASARCTAGELWHHLVQELELCAGPWREPLRILLEQGPLGRRILQRLGAQPTRKAIEAIYRELCDCLAEGRMLTC